MPFVLDNSVVMAWCFEDEANGYADQVLQQLGGDRAPVPPVWPLELANALTVAERTERLATGRLALHRVDLGTADHLS